MDAHAVSTALQAVSPIGEPSRRRRLVKVGAWIAGIVVLLVVLHLLGVDVAGWLESMWESIEEVPPGYLLAGIVLQVLQTTFNGVAYYGIIRYAYRDSGVTLWPIVAAYAVGVGMNSFLPANIGTFVTLLMFVAIVPGATFAGIIAVYLVNKIFFTVVGAVVYLLLFLEAGEAFDVELGWLRDHPGLFLVCVGGGVVLVVMLVRLFWRKLKGLWDQARQGGRILGDPTAYALRVLLPQIASYAAKVGVIAVFLAAYAIPVTFSSVVHVIGSSSAANMTSVTPGGVGVTQAANVVALRDYADSETATAYSLSQQLVTSATNVTYALILVIAVFGWSGGRMLVSDSYADSKQKIAERKQSRKDAKAAKRAKDGDGDGADDDEQAAGGDATRAGPDGS
jgi:uncharacterized membrane protein YbhN (UPF0104 family)